MEYTLFKKKSPNLSEEFKVSSFFFFYLMEIWSLFNWQIFSEANFTMDLSLKGVISIIGYDFESFVENKAH